MIQQAFISGQLGRAIYTENERRLVLSINDPSNPRRCTGYDTGLFFHSGAEYSLVPLVKNLEHLVSSLDRETRAYRALNLVLSSIDPDLIGTRSLNVEAAEELLGDDDVRDFVRRRLMARALPISTGLANACIDAERASATRVHALLATAQECQPAIKVLLQAWSNVAAEFFTSEHEAHDAEISLIESGVLEGIVSTLQSREYDNLNAIVARYSVAPQLAITVPHASRLLNALKNHAWLLAGYTPDKKKVPKERRAARRRDAFEAGDFRAALTSRLRMKHSLIIFPGAREQIRTLQQTKQERSKRDSIKEYRTITDADLRHSVQTSSVIRTEETPEPRGWNVVIQGRSLDGLTLKLHVWMAKEDDDSPLEIIYFDLIPEDEIGQETNSTPTPLFASNQGKLPPPAPRSATTRKR